MATVKTAKKGKTIPKQKKKLTDKQKLVQLSAQQRQKVQEQTFEWQEQLFSQSSVTIDILQQAALWLQPQTYEEVIEERNVQSFCGYPLCSKQPNIQSKYKISLSQRKVFDQTELSNYCSTSCLQKSKYYTMQLSEDPVWIRDFHSSIPSTIHIISMDENFSKVINEQQNKHKKGISDHDLKKGYVKKLLSNVPVGNNNHRTPSTTTEVSDINNKFDINIIENTTHDNIDLPVLGIHDAIEGFRIDTSKKNKEEPTTIVLNPTTEIVTSDTKNDNYDVDPEFLLDEAMETMKMLKDLELEEHNKNNIKEKAGENNGREVNDDNDDDNDVDNDDDDKPLNHLENDSNKNIQKNNNNDSNMDVDNHNKQSKKMASHSKKSSSTILNTVSVNDTISTTIVEPSLNTNQSSTSPSSNVIEIKLNAQKNASTNPKQSKKKKKEPEMSLFGKIWTLVDRLTTKTTRQFLASLKNGGDLTLLSKEGDINNADLLRGQIFSEKVLEMYGVIRSQMGIKEEIELDIVNLIRTFHFAEASMVVLEPDQTYMFTLVLFKALAPDLLTKFDWNQPFESCCEYIGQSSDMIDACVRVLKVAST